MEDKVVGGDASFEELSMKDEKLLCLNLRSPQI